MMIHFGKKYFAIETDVERLPTKKKMKSTGGLFAKPFGLC